MTTILVNTSASTTGALNSDLCEHWPELRHVKPMYGRMMLTRCVRCGVGLVVTWREKL